MVIEEIHIQNFKALQNISLKRLPPLAVFVEAVSKTCPLR